MRTSVHLITPMTLNLERQRNCVLIEKSQTGKQDVHKLTELKNLKIGSFLIKKKNETWCPALYGRYNFGVLVMYTARLFSTNF